MRARDQAKSGIYFLSVTKGGEEGVSRGDAVGADGTFRFTEEEGTAKGSKEVAKGFNRKDAGWGRGGRKERNLKGSKTYIKGAIGLGVLFPILIPIRGGVSGDQLVDGAEEVFLEVEDFAFEVFGEEEVGAVGEGLFSEVGVVVIDDEDVQLSHLPAAVGIEGKGYCRK